jgi:hypothetical protein
MEGAIDRYLPLAGARVAAHMESGRPEADLRARGLLSGGMAATDEGRGEAQRILLVGIVA